MSADVRPEITEASAAPAARGRSAPRAPRESGPLGALRLAHGLPWLLPRPPATLVALVRALLPRATGGEPLHAFGPRDLHVRGWYEKIASDQRRFGRVGYVWDDGFGLSLGPRFYNNFLTFWLYGALGARAYTALSVVVYLGVALALFAAHSALAMGAVLVVMLAASPLFLGAQFHLGKPEILWWVLGLGCYALAFDHAWLAAGVLFSALAIANFSAAFFTGVGLAALVALARPGADAFGLLAVGAAPGLIKTALRLTAALRARFVQRILEEQDDVHGASRSLLQRFTPLASDRHAMYLGLLGVASALVTIGHPQGGIAAGTIAAAAVVYALSSSAIYLADPPTLWMWHMSLLVAAAAVSPSWTAVLGILVFVYPHPLLAGTPASVAALPGESRLASLARRGAEALAAYPGFAPWSSSRVRGAAGALFADVPDGARVLVETRSADRNAGGYRALLLLWDNVAPERGIEVLPDEYVRIANPRAFRSLLARFNADADAGTLRLVLERAGATHVFATTREFSDALAAAGAPVVARLEPGEVAGALRGAIDVPSDGVAVHAVEGTGVLAPPAPIARRSRSLTWMARADTRYLVRYAFDRNFVATQDGERLVVEPEPVADAGDLTFMAVRSRGRGEIVLEHRGAWL
jgi:hypothetical protein